VCVGVSVGVEVGVEVGVSVGVSVGVLVGVCVGVIVGVGVGKSFSRIEAESLALRTNTAGSEGLEICAIIVSSAPSIKLSSITVTGKLTEDDPFGMDTIWPAKST
jgi:hypothetical protein